MNNYYTLIYLNDELKENIIGGEFRFAISPHKDVLECYIETERHTKRLVFSANPTEAALFLDHYRPPKKHNVLEFFEVLKGFKITSTKLAECDRLWSIYFTDGYRLLFKLFGNDVNVMLVRNDTIIDAFKHPESIKDDAPPRPRAPFFADTISANAKPKNQITKLNPLLPRQLLPALIRQHNVDAMTPEEVKQFTDKITRALLENPNPRVLQNGEICLLGEEILDLPTKKAFESINECVLYAYRRTAHLRRLHQKKDRLERVLQSAVRKKEAQYRQLQQADKSLERADEYEKFGHLLMAHAHKDIAPDTETFKTHDLYQNNEAISIPLKKGYSISENAQHYYEKAKSSRISYKKASERTPVVKKEKEKIQSLLDELQNIERLPALQAWIKQKEKMLEKLGYGTKDEGQSKSPFRKFKVGKYEIWIGKNAKSNDKLTAHAHKEDVWLHARGVAGSHAVIRMGNQKDFPPKEIILRAAAYAAYYSKARGMKTAPVMYTKCKYVYKPKGAAPGAVVAEREEVAMVPPLKPE